MVERDPLATQYDAVEDVVDELVAAGFAEPEEIGRGEFGVVYRCLQQSLDRTVAVKVLVAVIDAENRERFIREQRAMGRVSGHPNIVTVLEVGATSGGRPFIVMEYHSRGTLDSLIRKSGPLDWRSALRVGVKIAGALEAAHRAGILHRDVKPANILLTEYGDVQLTDFGIARIAGAFETGAGFIAGTPAFTAPEVLSGAAPTAAADLYGLGATLFCAVTGHVAFERQRGESVVAQFLRITGESVPELGTIDMPDALSGAVERAMAKNPADRPASSRAFGAELRAIGRVAGVGVDEPALRVEGSEDALHIEADPSISVAGSPTPVIGRRRRRGSEAAPPTLATKFRPPRRRRGLVLRPRLIDALRAGEGRRLTLIHAPPGYGKTTLAAQWADELAREGVKVGWLSIDDNDNNPVWFLTNLLKAMRRANPAIAGDLDEVLEERGADAERYVLTSLINDIDECDDPMAVVIDDWHRVTSAAAIGALDFLPEHAGDNLQVVIASRSRSGLPISRLRVRDELVEIDVRALCFDVAEARSFLVDVAGLELAGGEVFDLRNSTDGWVAGLQLASLSLRGADAPAQVIDRISGRDQAIADFLAENVLSTLEPEMQRFLLATSITERVCGSLASMLSDEPHGQAVLEEVEARDLFLNRVDDNGDWFRYHHLFRDFLRRRLDRDHPELTAPLHRKASQWFAEHHMLVEAVDHAVAAGDTGWAVELVETEGQGLLENSRMATLLGLVDKLPAAAVASNPGLQLTLAWVNTLLHRTDLARAALHRFDAAVTTMQGPEAADLRAIGRVVEATIRAFEDRTDGLDDLLSECLSRPDELPPFVVSVAANVAIFAATQRFDFDAVHRWRKWANRYHERCNGPFTVMYGYALDGIAAFEQLDLERAERCFRASRQVMTRRGWAHSQGALLAEALLAQLLYERGEIAEAQRSLNESFNLGAEEGGVEMINARFAVGAQLAVLRGDRAGAAELLDNGAAVAQRLSIPRLGASFENERVLLGLPTRRTVPAPIEYARCRRPVEGIAEITAQLEEDTAIRLLLAAPSAGGQHDLACRWAQEWVDRLQGRRRHRALLCAQRTLVECLSAAGRTAQAKQLLGVVLDRCAGLGMVRFPIDSGQRIVSLIAEIREDQLLGRSDQAMPRLPTAFLDRILDAAGWAGEE